MFNQNLGCIIRDRRVCCKLGLRIQKDSELKDYGYFLAFSQTSPSGNQGI